MVRSFLEDVGQDKVYWMFCFDAGHLNLTPTISAGYGSERLTDHGKLRSSKPPSHLKRLIELRTSQLI